MDTIVSTELRVDVVVCDACGRFLLAGGLISELGGSMTHGAIVSREVGLPAVTGVRAATSRLRTGDRVTMNGTTGRIEVLERAP
jgi:phosphoenolpyruvate-protein kinase (PTS system EI component)